MKEKTLIFIYNVQSINESIYVAFQDSLKVFEIKLDL